MGNMNDVIGLDEAKVKAVQDALSDAFDGTNVVLDFIARTMKNMKINSDKERQIFMAGIGVGRTVQGNETLGSAMSDDE